MTKAEIIDKLAIIETTLQDTIGAFNLVKEFQQLGNDIDCLYDVEAGINSALDDVTSIRLSIQDA